jgi:hypothetical protein
MKKSKPQWLAFFVQNKEPRQRRGFVLDVTPLIIGDDPQSARFCKYKTAS